MSYKVQGATKDNYIDALTLETLECARLTIIVSNAPIYYKLKVWDGIAAYEWDTEHLLPAATGQTFGYSFDRKFTGVMFRSGTAGQSATVIAQLIPQAELPD